MLEASKATLAAATDTTPRSWIGCITGKPGFFGARCRSVRINRNALCDEQLLFLGRSGFCRSLPKPITSTAMGPRCCVLHSGINKKSIKRSRRMRRFLEEMWSSQSVRLTTETQRPRVTSTDYAELWNVSRLLNAPDGSRPRPEVVHPRRSSFPPN